MRAREQRGRPSVWSRQARACRRHRFKTFRHSFIVVFTVNEALVGNETNIRISRSQKKVTSVVLVASTRKKRHTKKSVQAHATSIASTARGRLNFIASLQHQEQQPALMCSPAESVQPQTCRLSCANIWPARTWGEAKQPARRHQPNATCRSVGLLIAGRSQRGQAAAADLLSSDVLLEIFVGIHRCVGLVKVRVREGDVGCARHLPHEPGDPPARRTLAAIRRQGPAHD
jgi:hypothetical protein